MDSLSIGRIIVSELHKLEITDQVNHLLLRESDLFTAHRFLMMTWERWAIFIELISSMPLLVEKLGD